jgi:hypothetical protein
MPCSGYRRPASPPIAIIPMPNGGASKSSAAFFGDVIDGKLSPNAGGSY